MTDLESTTTYGTCECPAGTAFDDAFWHRGCRPPKELECGRHASTWSNDKCLCEYPHNFAGYATEQVMPAYATWNGQTCAYDPQREACEVSEGGTWNQVTGTCDCPAYVGGRPVGGVWDPVEWACVDPPSGPGQVGCWEANNIGLESGTCDCGAAQPGLRWNASLRQCAWSGETHGCQLDGHAWSAVGDTCDCTTGWPASVTDLDASEVQWDAAPRECRDLNGHLACELNFDGAVWSKAGTPATCNCLGWTPITGDGRWDALDRECVRDPVVSECIGDLYGEWDLHGDACDCSAHPDANAVLFGATWTYDPITRQGECWSQQQAMCLADPNATWQPGGCWCPGGWTWDDQSGTGQCDTSAAEQLACEAETFAEWDPVLETCFIPLNPEWKWYWNGTSGTFLYCDYDLKPGGHCPTEQEHLCDASGGTYRHHAPWSYDYCDCSTSTVPDSRWLYDACTTDPAVTECEASGLSWSHLWDQCDCTFSASGGDAWYVGGGCSGQDACCTSGPEDTCRALPGGTWDEVLGCSVGGVATCTAAGSPSWIGDDYCDVDGGFNSWMCGYDGGDCCASTNPVADCGDGCDCKDPAAP